MKSLTIRVPATTANLGPGFDCLGLALNLFNDFKVVRNSEGPNEIHGSGTCEGISGEDNLFFRAFRRVYGMAKETAPFIRVDVNGRVPLARGLGSSATAIVAGVLAANAMLGSRFTKDELLLAMTREEGHPDNVAPAYLGNLVAAVYTESRVIVKVASPHKSWRVAMFIPDYHLSTEKARKAIPKKIAHKDAVFNLTRVPLVIDALIEGRREDLGLVLEDRLHEPYRKHLIEAYDAIRAGAMKAGASAVYLSGAGPSMAAFCWGEKYARSVSEAMLKAAKKAGSSGSGIVLKPFAGGAELL